MEPARVFDTSALIAFLEGEPGADDVEELIDRAGKANRERFVSVVNIGEVWYNAARKRLDGDRVVAELLGLGFTVIDVDWQMARQASEIKLKYRLGYADSYAAALAKLRKLELVTCDRDFTKLGRKIKVRLLTTK